MRLAIDDFGTGYSSLGYLALLPIDIIKIDKSFVDGLLDDGDRREIIPTITTLAHALNVPAVAEGVETSDQAITLRAMGCHTAQGYHFLAAAAALPAEPLRALRSGRAKGSDDGSLDLRTPWRALVSRGCRDSREP